MGDAGMYDENETKHGEGLLGDIIDASHTLRPGEIYPFVTARVTEAGMSDVVIYLQDYAQLVLRPMAGVGVPAEAVDISGSAAGRAYVTQSPLEQPADGGATRMYLPMLDGTDRVGILALTAQSATDATRRLARQIAGLVADLIVTKGAYTDAYFIARRDQSMALPAQMQWQLLPPLTLTTPEVALAGILEPAYEVGGDSFDYALNGPTLHMAIIDAMGHGLAAATMATVAIGAYRHARRAGFGLAELYTHMDAAMSTQFGGDKFATAQLCELDVPTGLLTWVNAGHPAPLLLRDRRVVRALHGPTTWPIGLGGQVPELRSAHLQRGDRVLFHTDGITEERLRAGDQFGDDRLTELIEHVAADGLSAQETVRRLSHRLKEARGGRTSDDATLLLVEWAGTAPDAFPRHDSRAALED
jgi:serine phosphatase RsbU (regulator of sigma subunit)